MKNAVRHVGILGGGPGGLYLALLLKRQRPEMVVRVIERSPPDATWGFGVVLADGGLRHLAEADPTSYQQIQSALHWIPRQVFTVAGEAVPIDKARSGGAITRLTLLQILQRGCADAGVQMRFATHVADLDMFEDCDVVVGADGAGSMIRDRFAREFGTHKRLLTNHFAWFGAHRDFDASHLNFKPVPGGALCGHYYTYAPARSTFVMECDAPTWAALGLGDRTDTERRRVTQSFFAEDLDGCELVENNSIWRQFPVITNERWHHGRYVLIGDALHTAHFSIGSGTRMALEDAVALAGALTSGLPREDAFAHYVDGRAPSKAKLAHAAEGSFDWYERFSEKMSGQAPTAFALSFLQRTGRIGEERLIRDFPTFVAHARAKGVLPAPTYQLATGDHHV